MRQSETRQNTARSGGMETGVFDPRSYGFDSIDAYAQFLSQQPRDYLDAMYMSAANDDALSRLKNGSGIPRGCTPGYILGDTPLSAFLDHLPFWKGKCFLRPGHT